MTEFVEFLFTKMIIAFTYFVLNLLHLFNLVYEVAHNQTSYGI